jgi:D-tyrosyl-tRNA(Tyr) deacylase
MGETMRAVIQRVSWAEVKTDGRVTGRIGKGLLVLLGVGNGDSQKEADFLLEKIIHLRIFEDDAGKLNLSLLDIRGELMVISQFTLYADCRKGRRPSFTEAAPPEAARALYEHFLEKAKTTGLSTASGVFQTLMEVELVNSGPVTILLDTSRNF